MTSAAEPDLGFAGSSRVIATVGSLLVLAGAALAGVRFVGGLPVEKGFEGGLGAFALGTVIAAPGMLALLGLADRPALLLPAAIVLFPLSFLSFAGVLLPLLVPAVMLVVAFGRRSATRPDREVLVAIPVLVLLIAAAAALLVHEDPRSYTTPTGGGSTSDVITIGESLISLALVATAIATGWHFTAMKISGQTTV